MRRSDAIWLEIQPAPMMLSSTSGGRGRGSASTVGEEEIEERTHPQRKVNFDMESR